MTPHAVCRRLGTTPRPPGSVPQQGVADRLALAEEEPSRHSCARGNLNLLLLVLPEKGDFDAIESRLKA